MEKELKETAEITSNVSKRMKLKKTLYVGIGGTGVAALLKIKKCFIDSYGEIPPMIGFLAIDTDAASLNKSILSKDGKDIKLLNSELLACTVKGALNVYRMNVSQYGWVPSENVDKLSNIQGGGAGQVRSNGRFIAYYNNTAINNSIQAAVSRVNMPIPVDSKFTVERDQQGMAFPTTINVIASVAGGTGSGMLIDVLAIIRKAMEQKGYGFRLYPWIVLPEVFRAMNAGPCMSNVHYNTYGALRELDYICHHDPKNASINFGYSQINQPLFDYAFLINNTNKAGVTFTNLDDLVDVIATSVYLPANEMGDAISTPFDNIMAFKQASIYDVLNKKAWVASTGSAELIYDSHAVGRATAYHLIACLCNSMLQETTEGVADANAFVDAPEVMIRENNGRDDIIDALLSPVPSYSIEIDENTQLNEIEGYLVDISKSQNLLKEVGENYEKKLKNACDEFNKKLVSIMGRTHGKLGCAVSFIESLRTILSICKSEMQEELQDFQKKNSAPVQWNVLLKMAQTGRLFSKLNKEAVEDLKSQLNDSAKNLREEVRREWALKFYNAFEAYVNSEEQKVNGLCSNLTAIAEQARRLLVMEQNNAGSNSKFQVVLHTDAVVQASSLSLTKDMINAFAEYLKGGASSWIGQSKENIWKELIHFVEQTTVFKQAVDTTIDDVLRTMPVEEVKQYLNHIRTLAKPLWTYDFQGFTAEQRGMDDFVVLGVGNRDNSILTTDENYKGFFDTDTAASYASTHQHDRIFILAVESLLPIYAVNNFNAYEKDHINKVSRGFSLANYSDEVLNRRIDSENFKLVPRIQEDSALKFWVWGFIFKYIHFDVESGQYWVRSKKKGNALRKYRYDLGSLRNDAFETFKSQNINSEIEELIDAIIVKNGKDPIENQINDVKEKENYYEEYASLSPLESSNIDRENFKNVRDLLVQEIDLISK